MDNDIMKERRVSEEACAELPKWYSAKLHLALNVGGTALAAAAAFATSRGVTPLARVATIAGTALFSNAVEWAVHRFPMHRRFKFLEPVFDSHVRRHHAALTPRRMGIERWDELSFVLFGKWEIAGLAAIGLISAGALAAAFGPEVALTALGTEAAYIAAYELLHLAYHLTKDHPIRKLLPLEGLAEHHLRHHDLGLMGKWNFNITVPLMDMLMKTRITDAAYALWRQRHKLKLS